jgi:DNA primase
MCFDGHDKRTPSLCFVTGKNRWKCFGCGKGGDAIALVMEVIDCDFRSALDWFLKEFYIDARREFIGHRMTRKRSKSQLLGAIEPVENVENRFETDPELYSMLIANCSEISQRAGLEYLKEHGITTDTATRFNVRELEAPNNTLQMIIKYYGYERVFRSGLIWEEIGNPGRFIWNSYALLFPFSVAGSLRYIQGRLFRGEPKYINPRGISKPLYNIDRLLSLPSGATVHLCEGVPDAIAIEGQGLNAVAVLGATSFRPEWVDLFIRFKVMLLPDGDSGGKIFKHHVSHLFAKRGKTIGFIHIPDGQDAADVIARLRGAT